MSKIKYFFQQSWLLIVCSFFFGLLIAVANAAWSGRIEQNKIMKLNNLMQGLLPMAAKFEAADSFKITTTKGKTFESNIFKAVSDSNECVGWAFNCQGPGFQDKIELVVAVDAEFEKFSGFDVLFSNETPGFGDKIKLPNWRGQFMGTPCVSLQLTKTGDIETIDSEIVAITGATVSSDAVVSILNKCVAQIKTEMINKGIISDVK